MVAFYNHEVHEEENFCGSIEFMPNFALTKKQMGSTRIAIIVAGGTGTRMGADIPKQFLLLHGEPILMHTLRIFEKISSNPRIILVLPDNQIATWKDLCTHSHFNIKHEIVRGGETRFESVKNGLALIENDGLVAIHDGVRPLVSIEVVERCFKDAELFGSTIPVIKPVESVRLSNESTTYPIDRDSVYLVQTPQVFKASTIKRCYQTPWQSAFTDDASVAEFCGEKIHLVEGNRENIKITTPLDLSIAEVLLKRIPI